MCVANKIKASSNRLNYFQTRECSISSNCGFSCCLISSFHQLDEKCAIKIPSFQMYAAAVKLQSMCKKEYHKLQREAIYKVFTCNCARIVKKLISTARSDSGISYFLLHYVVIHWHSSSGLKYKAICTAFRKCGETVNLLNVRRVMNDLTFGIRAKTGRQTAYKDGPGFLFAQICR